VNERASDCIFTTAIVAVALRDVPSSVAVTLKDVQDASASVSAVLSTSVAQGDAASIVYVMRLSVVMSLWVSSAKPTFTLKLTDVEREMGERVASSPGGAMRAGDAEIPIPVGSGSCRSTATYPVPMGASHARTATLMPCSMHPATAPKATSAFQKSADG
jgi:hypothetical protein